jgi:hypothetical protein
MVIGVSRTDFRQEKPKPEGTDFHELVVATRTIFGQQNGSTPSPKPPFIPFRETEAFDTIRCRLYRRAEFGHRCIPIQHFAEDRPR